MQPINLPLADLEAILAVANTGSFRAAADALHVSQPAVSARVRHAEDVLGVKLFHRTTRKVELTAHGERLCVRASHTLAELQALVQEFKDEAHMRRGRVVLGATPTLASSVLPAVLQRFRIRWPAIELVLKDDFFGNTLDRVVEGEVDFAITPAYKPDPRILLEPILSEEILLVGPPDHPLVRAEVVDLARVAEYPLLVMPPGTAIWGLLTDAFAQQGLSFKVHMQLMHVLSIVALIRAGVGLTFLPRGLISLLNSSSLGFSRVGPKGLYRAVSITTAKGRSIQPAAEALREEFRYFKNVSAERISGVFPYREDGTL